MINFRIRVTVDVIDGENLTDSNAEESVSIVEFVSRWNDKGFARNQIGLAIFDRLSDLACDDANNWRIEP